MPQDTPPAIVSHPWTPRRWRLPLLVLPAPLWAGIFLGRAPGPWDGGDWAGLWVAGSLSALLAALALNRTVVSMQDGELTLRTEPIRIFRARRIARAGIDHIYYWRQMIPTRTGAREEWAVNARLRQGHDAALLAGFETEEEASRAAAGIGAAAGVPARPLAGPPGRDWAVYRRMALVILWIVAGPAALALLIPR